jgi:hypothetical protein
VFLCRDEKDCFSTYGTGDKCLLGEENDELFDPWPLDISLSEDRFDKSISFNDSSKSLEPLFPNEIDELLDVIDVRPRTSGRPRKRISFGVTDLENLGSWKSVNNFVEGLLVREG